MRVTISSFKIAVLAGDGIGVEVARAACAVLECVARRHALDLNLVQLPGGAQHYSETGVALPETSFSAGEQADAILFGAMGLPTSARVTARRSPRSLISAPGLDFRSVYGPYGLFQGCRFRLFAARIVDRLCDRARTHRRHVRRIQKWIANGE